MLAISSVTVVITGGAERVARGLRVANDTLLGVASHLTVEGSVSNTHEYMGVHRAWQEGVDHPDRIVLYTHCKGVSHGKAVVEYFDAVVVPWRGVLNFFDRRPDVNKVGWACSIQGFEWYNFWWMRGGFGRFMAEPHQVSRRHYYEEWLARENNATDCRTKETWIGMVPYQCWSNHLDDCYSLSQFRTPTAALTHMTISSWTLFMSMCMDMLRSLMHGK